MGENVKNDDEIILSEGFAVNMDVAIGDHLKIGENSYTVVSFMQRPDYLYMLENEDDIYKNISTFYLTYMTDAAFDAVGDTSSIIYLAWQLLKGRSVFPRIMALPMVLWARVCSCGF